MTDAAQMLLDGWQSHWELLGCPTFIYLGRHWPCTPSGLRRGMALGLGPPVEELQRSFTVPKNAMAIRTMDQNEGWNAGSQSPTADSHVMPPHPGKTVILNAREYEIESVEEDASGAFWTVHLLSPHG